MGNFASLPSAQSALLIFEDYGGLWGYARRGIVRVIVRLMGRLVAEKRLGFSLFAARVRIVRTVRTMRTVASPCADSQFFVPSTR
jgi:hypothetical protein